MIRRSSDLEHARQHDGRPSALPSLFLCRREHATTSRGHGQYHLHDHRPAQRERLPAGLASPVRPGRSHAVALALGQDRRGPCASRRVAEPFGFHGPWCVREGVLGTFR